ELLTELGSDAAAAATTGPTVNLYGKWQTNAWEPPTAVDGIVPKNERGNVECPPLVPCLPRRTVHLTLGPGLGAICRTLGLDYAPALVGFEVQGGRMVPTIEGVVVCEEMSEIVVAAYVERESARAEAAAAARRRVAEAAWRRLLASMRVRLQLEKDYAGGGEARGEARGVENVVSVGGRGEATAKGGAAAAAALSAAWTEAAAVKERGGDGRPRSAVEAAAVAAAAKGVPRDLGIAAEEEAARQRLQSAAGDGQGTGAEGAGWQAGGPDTGADVEMEEF
ncbi:hypothetical protein Agub_g518, partial [Astrephomene gubernaculifera]